MSSTIIRLSPPNTLKIPSRKNTNKFVRSAWNQSNYNLKENDYSVQVSLQNSLQRHISDEECHKLKTLTQVQGASESLIKRYNSNGKFGRKDNIERI